MKKGLLKKLLVFTLVGTMALPLMACGNNKDANGNNIVVRKNEVVVDFETMTMQSFAHSPDTDNTPLQSVLEGVPEGETEII